MRIVREVAVVGELARVHEGGEHHHVTVIASSSHERQVTVVQGAHRRHEPDTKSTRAYRLSPFAPRAKGAHSFHGTTLASANRNARFARAPYVALSSGGTACKWSRRVTTS